MAEEKKDKEKRVKRPSALKRNLQSEKNRLRNRSFRSSVNTAVRALKDAVAQKEDPSTVQTHLRKIYSMVDKGVKTGIFKSGKGARTKSRLSLFCAKN